MLGKRSVALPRMPIVEKLLLKKITTKVCSVMPVEKTSINISLIYCEEVVLQERYFSFDPDISGQNLSSTKTPNNNINDRNKI